MFHRPSASASPSSGAAPPPTSSFAHLSLSSSSSPSSSVSSVVGGGGSGSGFSLFSRLRSLSGGAQNNNNESQPQNIANQDSHSVFNIDDNLSELNRVRRYSLSQLPLQRLVYVRRLSECARSPLVGLRESVRSLLPLFPALVSDTEAVVRTAAAQELANMAHFFAEPLQPYSHTPSSVSSFSLPSSVVPPSMSTGSSYTAEDESEELLTLPTLPTPLTQTQNNINQANNINSPPPPPAVGIASSDDMMDVDGSVSKSVESSREHDNDMDTSLDGVINNNQPIAPSSNTLSPLDAPTSAQSVSPSISPSSSSSPAPVSVVPLPAVPPSPSSFSAPSPPAHNNNTHTNNQTSNQTLTPLSDPQSPLRVESYELIKDQIIPSLQTLILDSNPEVRNAACDSLVRVAEVLRGDDVGKVVLTLVLNLAHDERDEQRTTAVHLMHELAPKLGHDLCRNFVALELAAFADDATFRVRKATASSFGNVAAMVGEAFTVAKLLPCYVRLSKDLIWGVRKGCVDSLVAVSRVVSPSVRAEVLIPMLLRFSKDTSRWVRNGAFEVLGPFIHAIGAQLVSQELLALFANIPLMSNAVVDADVNFHAAFNLPAVLLTVGVQRWEELLPCFNALVKDSKFPVRRTLACSLHEVARLLGPSLSEQHLLPALDVFLRDLDEVKYGVLRNMALILQAITPQKRLIYLEVIWSIQKQAENWRWRLLWAKQLGAFSQLYSLDTNISDIIPLSLALCRDGVAAVRKIAAKSLGLVLHRMLFLSSASNSAVQSFLHDIQSFAMSSTFSERQLYCRMLEGFNALATQELYDTLLEAALPLLADPTSNVRVALAQSVLSMLQQSGGKFHTCTHAHTMVYAMEKDQNVEIKNIIQQAKQLFEQSRAPFTPLNQDTLSSTTDSTHDSSASMPTCATSGESPSQHADDDDLLADILSGPSALAVPSDAVVITGTSDVTTSSSPSSAPPVDSVDTQSTHTQSELQEMPSQQVAEIAPSTHSIISNSSQPPSIDSPVSQSTSTFSEPASSNSSTSQLDSSQDADMSDILVSFDSSSSSSTTLCPPVDSDSPSNVLAGLLSSSTSNACEVQSESATQSHNDALDSQPTNTPSQHIEQQATPIDP